MMLNLLSYFAETDKYFIKVLERNEESELLDIRFRLCNPYKVKAKVLHRSETPYGYYFYRLLILKENENFEEHTPRPEVISDVIITGDFIKETSEDSENIRLELREEITRNLEEIIPNLNNGNNWQEVNLYSYRSKQNA